MLKYPLFRPREIHRLQEAFLEVNAAQCGYCTSGIIMRLKWLLDNHSHPTREQVCQALEGHLCRCGAHPRVIRAVERAIAIKQVNRS